LKALGGSSADAGLYGAAQNLAGVPGLFALSFSPLVLSSLNRARHHGHEDGGHRFAEFAVRIVVLMFPFVALAAACADEIVRFVFGATFAPAGPTLAILLGGAMSMLVISVTTSVLLAFDRPSWAAWLTVPLVPVAVIAHLVVIPRFGAAGAATVTASSAAAAAIATLVTVHAAWAILPGPGTWLRAAAASIAVVLMANAFPADGAAVLMKLAILSAGIVAVYFTIGGVSVDEARSVLRRADAESPGKRTAE
jgi:O-antigen/teichoic acid export membrane protein